MLTVTYYDKYDRVIQTIGDNHKGGTDRICNKYNFAGELLTTLQFHNVSGKSMIKTGKLLTYDHAGRLLKTEEQIVGYPKITTSELVYNELGQLITKKLHKTSNSYLQWINYSYNMRGWLTSLGSSLFSMQLYYNTLPGVSHLTNKLNYNGNISAMRWYNSQSNINRAYGFTYDELNRLKKANYADGINLTDNTEAFNEEIENYDENGNIIKLKRLHNGNISDYLTYSYTNTGKSNQLSTIKDITDTPYNYEYDSNGNVSFDGKKGIHFAYNILNLPSVCNFDDFTLRYVYDAVGNKLQKQILNNNGDIQKTTNYISGFIYESEASSTPVLKSLMTDEGRITFENPNAPKYEYFLKDHLGNIRSVFTNNNGVPLIMQETNYYPFGKPFAQINNEPTPSFINKNLFNGKELQNDVDHPQTDLNLLDITYRYYDFETGRFNSIDRLAEKYPYKSPYDYAENRVPNGIDLDGLEYYWTMDGILAGNVGYSQDVRILDDSWNANIASSYIGIANYNLKLDLEDDMYLKALNSWSTRLDYKFKEFHDLAGALYAEAEAGTGWEERAGIFSVLENRSIVDKKTIYAEAKASGQMFGWNAREKIDSPMANNDDVQSAYKGLIRGILDLKDYSGGGYYWQGKDFKEHTQGSTAHEDFYEIGFYFTNKNGNHDKFQLGNKISGEKNWNYKYESTNAIGKTTFMRLTQDWQKANKSNWWNGTYKK